MLVLSRHSALGKSFFTSFQVWLVSLSSCSRLRWPHSFARQKHLHHMCVAEYPRRKQCTRVDREGWYWATWFCPLLRFLCGCLNLFLAENFWIKTLALDFGSMVLGQALSRNIVIKNITSKHRTFEISHDHENVVTRPPLLMSLRFQMSNLQVITEKPSEKSGRAEGVLCCFLLFMFVLWLIAGLEPADELEQLEQKLLIAVRKATKPEKIRTVFFRILLGVF